MANGSLQLFSNLPEPPISEDNLAIFLTVAATILESRAPSTEAESCSTLEAECGEEPSHPWCSLLFFVAKTLVNPSHIVGSTALS